MSTRRKEKKKTTTQTTKRKTARYYKRTREEALACENIPAHELFDLNTGLMLEKYRRERTPSPPAGTVVYEVGTGRAYKYVSGTGVERLSAHSVAMHEARKAAAAAAAAATVTSAGATDLATILDERGTTGGQQAAATATSAGGDLIALVDERRTGGLQRVTPLPLLSCPRHDRETAAVSSEGESGRGAAIKTERLETPPSHRPGTSSSSFFSPPTAAADPECNCVALVTTDNVHVDILKPKLADFNENADRLLDASPTLRYLRAGYRFYARGVSEETHQLCAYQCRSVRTQVYNPYKSISCIPDRPPAAAATTEESPESESGPSSLLCRTMTIINQYLNVFSSLADFGYTWIVPALKGGVCTAMVVDKVWTYSPVRRINVPYYRLLVGDGYTDLVVNELRKLENRGIRIRHVRFLSTWKTVLYTNRRTLTKLRDGRYELDRREFEQRTASAAAATRARDDDDDNVPLPFKKRRVEGADGTRTTAEQPSRFRAVVLHEEVSERSTNEGNEDDGDETTRPAKNPTLVVFKHSLSESEPDTLLCNIVVEMHLGDRLRY